jgi:hypothetical protein
VPTISSGQSREPSRFGIGPWIVRHLDLGEHGEEALRLGCKARHELRGLLVRTAEADAIRDARDARDGLQGLQVSERQRITERDAAGNIQAVCVRAGNRLLDAGIETLQHAEQREGAHDLQQHEDGASPLAPDAGPDERQELHSSSLKGASKASLVLATCGNQSARQAVPG